MLSLSESVQAGDNALLESAFCFSVVVVGVVDDEVGEGAFL